MQELQAALKSACQQLFNADIDPELSRPEEKFGDWATNAALQLGKQLGKNPREVAVALAGQMHNVPGVADVQIAGPGFINIKLTDEKIAQMALAATDLPKPLAGQEIVVEYSDPNPFKILHVGHLYTGVVGDAIANLLEDAGANIARVNFGGDVGLHVAKAMYSILNELGGEHPEELNKVPVDERAEWLAKEYVTGSLAYGDDERIDKEIKELNKKIYQIHERNDHSSKLAQIYWTTRKWSYEDFDKFYALIGTHFDRYYPESETTELGLKIVNENIGKVFEKSDNAIVFKGELHNLHTRVFINSDGLPTYETKDVGLIFRKWEDYHFDKSIVITGNDIYEYMQVVLKAVEKIKPELAQKTTHITHGMVKLSGGEKMSSRTGNVYPAMKLLLEVKDAVHERYPDSKVRKEITFGAVKYAFLKHRLGSDIIFDINESVSLEGNSGPYLQYAYARAVSILHKSTNPDDIRAYSANLNDSERSLMRKVSEYPEVVAKASNELMPHHICTYLYELAQNFNSFYEKNRVIGSEREIDRIAIVQYYASVLKHGLGLLNIAAPEHM